MIWKKEQNAFTLLEGEEAVGSVQEVGGSVVGTFGEESQTFEYLHPTVKFFALGNARIWVQEAYAKKAGVKYLEEISYDGINPIPNERWELGMSHHPKSLEILKAIAEYDHGHNNDLLDLNYGGDGDNGETIMFLLDMYFEGLDDT